MAADGELDGGQPHAVGRLVGTSGRAHHHHRRNHRRTDLVGCAGAARSSVTERLANSLRPARKGLGLTQAALAERVGVSRNTVNTVENGVFVPSALLALKLAAALGQPVEALFRIERD